MKQKKSVSPVKLWKRVIAYVIDVIIINIIIIYPFKNYLGDFEEDLVFNFFNSGFMLALLLIFLLTILYWTILEYLLNQSVGKAFMNIYVRSTNKQKLSFWQCLLRNLSKVSTLLLFIDSLGIIFKKDYQRFLEKLSKTEVVDSEF